MVANDKLIPLAGLRLKYLTKIDNVTIDDKFFNLHYRFTFIILLAFSVLITCTQFFGEAIQCIKGGDVPDKLLNTYCWVEGTFTLPNKLLNAIDTEVAAPGVSQYRPDQDKVIEHSWYQWVCIVLFFQAIMFYGTRMVWKMWEKGRMKIIVQELYKVALKPLEKKKQQDILIKYLSERKSVGSRFTYYGYRYYILEVVNFFHVIIQMVFVNWFLGGEFSKYGLQVLQFIDLDQDDRPDPMVRVFPKLTKCTFHRYGSSGDVMRYDSLCLLPLNVLNEKIYIFIWLWFYALAVISGCLVIYRTIIIGFPRFRYFFLRKLHPLISNKHHITLLNNCSYSEWFLLYLLGKNLDMMHYRDLIEEYAEKLQNDGKDSLLPPGDDVVYESEKAEKDGKDEDEKQSQHPQLEFVYA